MTNNSNNDNMDRSSPSGSTGIPFTANIYVVGAQCTGKTTLVNALSDYFCHRQETPGDAPQSPPLPCIIQEVARTVLAQHNFTAHDITSSPSRALELQRLILEAQQHAEQLASSSSPPDEAAWYISDRSGADPIVYARKYSGEEAAMELLDSAEWAEVRENMRRGLVVVCEAGANWLIDDGVRLMPGDREEWVEFHNLFCMCLQEWGIDFVVLPRTVIDVEQRVSFVLENWERRGYQTHITRCTLSWS